jgi:hypothetical protein
MFRIYLRDNGDIWGSECRERRHLANCRNADFYRGNVVFRMEAEQGDREPQFVIQIACGAMRPKLA